MSDGEYGLNAVGGMMGDPNPDPSSNWDAPDERYEEHDAAAVGDAYEADASELEFDDAFADDDYDDGLTDAHQVAEAERLVAEFPELGVPEVAQEVVVAARAEAERIGRPDLADDMRWIGEMYASSGVHEHFEHERTVDAIVGARRGSSVLPFAR